MAAKLGRFTAVVLGAWGRIHEPRVVALMYFLGYVGFLLGGIYAIANPPTSLQGETGAGAMYALAGLLSFGGLIGSIAALPGTYWLERSAVLAIGLAGVIYGGIIIGLHITSSGNRLLQFAFIWFVLCLQVIRWFHIRDRPYRPEAPTATQV